MPPLPSTAAGAPALPSFSTRPAKPGRKPGFFFFMPSLLRPLIAPPAVDSADADADAGAGVLATNPKPEAAGAAGAGAVAADMKLKPVAATGAGADDDKSRPL